MNANQALGMLMGLHVGDSLGATLEFGPPMQRPEFHTEIIGGGAFDWDPGAATDDTDLMICVLQSMSSGEFDSLSAAELFQEWFKKRPRDVGLTTRSAISAMAGATDPTKCGVKGEMTMGNGSLMRCAPLALLGSRALLKNYDAVTNQCKLTHGHNMCVAADHVFIDALVLIGDGVPISQEVVVRKALDRCPDIERLYNNKYRHYGWEDLQNPGSAPETLCTAFWALENTCSFEEGVTDIVNRGGDADTCGAVTGALLGAYYGIDSIPTRWLAKIKRFGDIAQALQGFWDGRANTAGGV